MEKMTRGTLEIDVVPYEGLVINLPDGFAEEQKGKTLEEQLERWHVQERTVISKWSYGDCDSTRETAAEKDCWQCGDVHGVLTQDGVIVGLVLFNGKYLFVGEELCTYSASEDDGPGSTDRDDYLSVVLV